MQSDSLKCAEKNMIEQEIAKTKTVEWSFDLKIN